MRNIRRKGYSHYTCSAGRVCFVILTWSIYLKEGYKSIRLQFIYFSNFWLVLAGISLITNKVIHEYESTQKPPTHEEVMDTSAKRAQDLQKLVKAIVKNIPPDGEGKQREN